MPASAARRAITQAMAGLEGQALENQPRRVSLRDRWAVPAVLPHWHVHPADTSPGLKHPVRGTVEPGHVAAGEPLDAFREAVSGPTTSSTASVRGSMLTAASASPGRPSFGASGASIRARPCTPE
jgi:hypothetical protein